MSLLAARIVELHGEQGRAWIESLPALIRASEERWQLVVEPPFADLTYHWVAPATTGAGTRVVLKLGVPGAETVSEVAVLRAWDGRGAARVIEADVGAGALLLERLSPGTRLAELSATSDDDATTVTVELIAQLHGAAPPRGLPTLDERTAGITRAAAAGFAPSLTPLASRLRVELLATAPPAVLLHADLHHFNVLRAERQPWLAIDPKGVTGDPAYEPAPFLYNPIDRVLAAPDAARLVARRIDVFAQHLPRQRVVDWAYVQAVLSAWWSFEDHGHGHEPALGFAELVAQLR